MITPKDIEYKEFSRSMKGYDRKEVDLFLDEVMLDYQALIAENNELKKTVEELNEDIRQYKNSESSMLNTLESAKKLMADISQSAEKRAEIIINNAHANANNIQQDARDSISKLNDESKRLQSRVKRFKDKYRELLEDELRQIDGSTEELLEDLERELLPKEDIKMYEPKAYEPKAYEPKAYEPKTPEKAEPQKGISADTVVLNEKSLEDMLMEEFGASKGEDLTKTRVIR